MIQLKLGSTDGVGRIQELVYLFQEAEVVKLGRLKWVGGVVRMSWRQRTPKCC